MPGQRFIIIPNTNRRVYENSVVELFRLPNLKWILHYGFYQYSGQHRKGWYFSAIPSDTTMPVFQEDLVNLKVLDPPGPGPVPPIPPVPPVPPVPPTPPSPSTDFTEEDKEHLDAALITFQDLEARDKYSSGDVTNGKVVKVNDIDGQGTVEYYSWNSETSTWDLASLGYRYMTRDEIMSCIGSSIVSIVWSNNNGALVITDNNSQETTVPLTGLLHDPVYTPENLTLRIPIYGAEDFIMRLPRDKYLQGLRCESSWDFGSDVKPAIVATVSDGLTSTEIAADATKLRTIFDGKETATVAMTLEYETGEVKANVKLSSIANNPLKVDNEGMWVDLSGVVAKKEIAAGLLLVADGNGEFTYGGTGVEIEQTTAIADLTTPSKKVVTANLITDAITAAIVALQAVLEDAIADLSGRVDELENAVTDLTTKVSDIEDRINYGTGDTGEIIVSGTDESLLTSSYKIGTDTLSTTSDDTVATEAAIVKAFSWQDI